VKLRAHPATLAALLGLGLGTAAPALAQSDTGGIAIIGKLKPVSQSGSGTRGIAVPGAAAPANPNAAPAPVWPGDRAIHGATAWVPARSPALEALRPRGNQVQPPAISMPIVFAVGSATLTGEAERLLAPLGEALASADLRGYRFRIEAHTDTVGDADANMALTEQRAAAVRAYLTRYWGIDERRLIAIGFGSSQPLVPTPPQVPELRNRRIQVVNLGS
jgi:outer membrane protein OmpA-like peptidoglycan-associated protein